MQIRLWQHEEDAIVYDAGQIETPGTELFDPEWWRSQGLTVGSFSGRGKVHVVRRGLTRWVLRRYRRGGLVGKLIDDSYVWTGLAATRPWREWHLLADLHQRGLPVPRPVAAHVARQGLRYSGDILSELIDDARPLSQLLRETALPASEWSLLGRTVRRFHDQRVHHPDLNASNILRASDGAYFLVDFDRGSLDADAALLDKDLRRLRRSLDKEHGKHEDFRFEERDWQSFLSGYQD